MTQVGIGLGGRLNPSEYADVAARIESHGFDSVSVFGDLMMHPPAMVLAGMASATSRIELGPSAYNPWTLHPVEMAGQMAFIEGLAPGRVFIGLVRGAWLDQLGLNTRDALTAITDSVEIVNRILSGSSSAYRGKYYSLAENTTAFYPIPSGRMPWTIGAWGPKLSALAGRMADELVVGGSANPAMIGVARAAAATGEAEAGRADGSTGVALSAVTVVDHDREAARSRARTEAALPFEVVSSLDPTLGVDPELLRRMKPLLREHRFEEAGRLIPDDLLDMFTFSGSPTDIVDQACAVFEAGASRVEFDSPFGITTERGLDILGTDVLPALRSAFPRP